MKLRNKKTGKIINYKELLTDEFLIDFFSKDFNYFDSKLDKIKEDWEDYEEPKEFWFVDAGGEVEEATYLTENDKTSLRNFGNYFETKEEANKAVEKLKALTKLKDRWFRFDNWDLDADDKDVNISLRSDKYKGNQVYAFEEDLDLLFGGEE